MPALVAALTTARITAFSPGASPPPVSTPIFFILGIVWDFDVPRLTG
jgi:hypothetical protein